MTSKLLKSLQKIKEKPDINLEEVIKETRDDSLVVITIVCILPFMQPIPLPGLSSFLGLIVFLQGLGLVFSKKPILTIKMKTYKISHDKFNQIYHVAQKVMKLFSLLSLLKHPLAGSRISYIVCGVFMMFASAILSLPLPIPFSNFIPALSILLMAIGLLEEDLLLILSGISISFFLIFLSLYSYQFIYQELLRKGF